MTVNRITLGEVLDWADKSHIHLGDTKKEGLVVLPANEGKFYVYYNEFCPINEVKYQKAAAVRGQTAMIALFKFLEAHKILFAMYIEGTQPRFTVNASPRERVELHKLKYFYSLHIDVVSRGPAPANLPPGYVDRITDDGK